MRVHNLCVEGYMVAATPHHCVDCVTTHNAILHKLCQHDNTCSVLLPNHPPEVLNCVRKGPLGGNECRLLSVALHTHIQRGETHIGYKQTAYTAHTFEPPQIQMVAIGNTHHCHSTSLLLRILSLHSQQWLTSM